MAATAPQIQFRQELVLTFEQRKSLLLDTVTNEAVIKGATATFILSGTNATRALTRGSNGMIPYRTEDMNQLTCALSEKHAAFRKQRFNIFSSQGDQRQSMVEASMANINTELDAIIIEQLDTATNQVSATAATGSLALIMAAYRRLGANWAASGQISAVITPAFHSYLLQTDAFTSADYISKKPFERNAMAQFNWMGIEFIVHANLTGVGTASEKCYMYNKAAMGCAMDVNGMQVEIGYVAENDHSFSRASFYGGARLLQQAGVIQMLHVGN